jgi:hypothetical protein
MPLAEPNNKNIRELYRGIHEFKKGYQCRTNSVIDENCAETNFVKDVNGHVFTDSHNILNRWKNYFCQFLNAYGVNNVRQTEIHTEDLLE